MNAAPPWPCEPLTLITATLVTFAKRQELNALYLATRFLAGIANAARAATRLSRIHSNKANRQRRKNQ
jgi:hypothetical protein